MMKISPLVPKPRQFNQIPVYRVDSDARELTPAEMDRFNHLIPRDSQRQNSHNSSRNDVVPNPVPRSRNSLRNRSANGNQMQNRDFPINLRPQPPIGTASSNSSNNNVNQMNERLFPLQPPNVNPSNSVMLMDRIVGNGSRMDNEPFLFDPEASSGRSSRNSFNNVSLLQTLNRTSNSGSVVNQNVSLAGGLLMNAGI